MGLEWSRVFHPLYNCAVRGLFQVDSGTSRSPWEEEEECAAFQGSPFHFGVILLYIDPEIWLAVESMDSV